MTSQDKLLANHKSRFFMFWLKQIFFNNLEKKFHLQYGRNVSGPDHNSQLAARCQFHQHFMLAFLYNIVLSRFSLVTAWLCYFFGAKILAQKLLVKMMIKLTEGFQKHKHFTGNIFYKIVLRSFSVFCFVILITSYPFW